jgi:zinc protease
MLAVWLLIGCPKTPIEVAEPVDPELAKPLPVDAKVHIGTFDNGMRWYVQQNAEPDDRAVLRLVVDVGSVLEDPDQLGIAHFVEHMAFNGTKNFPGNELIRYLESVGTQFGPHLNAHTSFDETVYKLTVPTDKPEVFEKAFLVLADWASGLSFDPAEIEAERPVVLEEWRTRLGASGRIDDVVIPALFFNSPYAERRPIGTEQSLRTFTPEAAKRFYQDWYRPDRMAVIAVGDFDPERVKALIQQHFSPIPKPPADARQRVFYEIPDHPETRYAIVADPEVPRAGVTLVSKLDRIEGNTHGDYRKSLLEQLAFQVINERLGEIARQPDPPFLGAGAGIQRLSPKEGAFSVSAGTREDRILPAYESLLTEIRRVREHGLREPELARARARVLKGYDSLLLERDKIDSTAEASELVRVFTTGESMPGTDYEVEMARKYVPAITLAELDGWLKGWMPDRSRVITVILPRKEGLPVPTEDDLRAVESRVAAATIAPPPEEVDVGALVEAAPQPGSVTREDPTTYQALGLTGWTLSNGVQVWFKDTDFKEDEVVFTAFSDGGESLVPDADFVSSRLMTEVLARSGWGRLDANAIERWRAGRAFQVNPALAEGFEIFSGSGSPSDLGPMLETLWAQVNQPKFTEDGFRGTLEQREARLRNREADPMTRFQDAYTTLLWKDDPRRLPWTVETLSQASLPAAERAYRDRFGDFTGATFVFVGNLPDDFRAQVERYVATLPAAGRAEAFQDRGKRPAPGKLEAEVSHGVDPVGRVRLEWRGTLEPNDWVTRSQLYALGDVLDTLLREELREELGGVYGVGVAAIEEYRPANRYTVRVEFGCDPARIDELIKATEGVVNKLRKEGPDPAIVAQEQEKNRRSRQTDLRTNTFWSSAISNALQRGADPKEILTWDQRNDALNAKVVQDAAKRWLADDQRVKVVLKPAQTATTPSSGTPAQP